MTGLRVFNQSGFIQFDSDKTTPIRYISKGLAQLGKPISYSATSSLIVNTPAGLAAPLVALRCLSPVAPYIQQRLNDGSTNFYFNSNGAQGGNCAYYIFDGAPINRSGPSAHGAGLRVYRPDGTLCFDSDDGIFSVFNVLSGYGSQCGLTAGRLYAATVSSFSGFLHQTSVTDETGKNSRYVQTTGSMGVAVNVISGSAQVSSVGWADTYSAPQHVNVDMPAVPVIILDVTSFGTVSGETTYIASMSPDSASATQQQTSSYSFPAESITMVGTFSNPSYSWSLQNTSGGNWSISSGQGTSSAVATVTGVSDGSKATAIIQCSVSANGTSQLATASLGYYSSPNPNAVAVSMNPGDQNLTNSASPNPTSNFPQEVINVSNGSASSYNWFFENTNGGNWSISSGQGTSAAVAQVSGVGSGFTATVTFSCNVVVNGTTYKKSANLQFNNTYQGSAGSNQN